MGDFFMEFIVVVIVIFFILFAISGLLGLINCNLNNRLFSNISIGKVKLSNYELSVLKELNEAPSVRDFDNCADCRYFSAYEEDSSLVANTIEFDIAGVNMRPNKAGAFIGMLLAEPDNKYDKNAIAIYNLDRKLLGYIPRGETAMIRKKYDKFGDGRCARFIYGYIRDFAVDKEKRKLYGKIFMPTDINPFGNIADVKQAGEYIADFSIILKKVG